MEIIPMQENNSNKKVQELTLNTLSVLIDFCEQNELRYYVTGGALIGVLRHKGFIPWDDDIDLGLPRKDFERLHELLKTKMPSGFGICNRFNNNDWHFAMSQFVDLNSEIEINIAEKTRKSYIWIDVFPIDGLPDGSVARWFRVKNILFHRYIVQLAYISTQVDIHKKRPLIEKIILCFFKIIPLGKLFDTNKIIDNMEKILRKNDFYNSNWCGNMLGRYREREVVPSAWFGTPKKGEFEGMLVNIPEKSHEILQALYGEYMKLPPEKDRVAHNVRIIKCRNI